MLSREHHVELDALARFERANHWHELDQLGPRTDDNGDALFLLPGAWRQSVLGGVVGISWIPSILSKPSINTIPTPNSPPSHTPCALLPFGGAHLERSEKNRLTERGSNLH